MIGKLLFGRLSGVAGITALVDQRISPEMADPSDAVYPMLVYEIGDLQADQTYGGSSTLVTGEFAVTAIAATHEAASDLAELVRAALDGEDGTWGGIVVQGCFFEGQSESTASVAETGHESTLYLIELTFSVAYESGA